MSSTQKPYGTTKGQPLAPSTSSELEARASRELEGYWSSTDQERGVAKRNLLGLMPRPIERETLATILRSADIALRRYNHLRAQSVEQLPKLIRRGFEKGQEVKRLERAVLELLAATPEGKELMYIWSTLGVKNEGLEYYVLQKAFRALKRARLVKTLAREPGRAKAKQAITDEGRLALEAMRAGRPVEELSET